MDDRAVLAARALRLDVPRGRNEALDVEARVAERGLGLRDRDAEERGQLRVVVRELDPATAAAARRLEEHGVAGLAREPPGLLERRDLAAGHERQAGLGRLPARRELVAGELDDLGGRPAGTPGPPPREPRGARRRTQGSVD